MRMFFLVLFFLAFFTSTFHSQEAIGRNEAVLGQSTIPRTISIGFFQITRPEQPTIQSVEPLCVATKAHNKVTWQKPQNSLGILLFRNDKLIANTSGTEFTDTGVGLPNGLLRPEVEYCYSVRNKVRDGNPLIGIVISQPSYKICKKTPNCQTLVGISPTTILPTPTPSVVPTSGPTATPTLRPTKTPVPTPPVTPDCQSTTVSNGRRVLNAKKFGGDGAAIQKALDCFKNPDYGGGAVYVPSGTYIISDKIRVYSNVTLFGDGIDQTVLQLHDSMLTDEGGMLANDTNYGHENIAVRELTLRGLNRESGLNNCCPGILLRQVEGGFLDKIKVENFSWHGIRLAYLKQKEGGAKDTVKSVRISNCQILNNKGDGVAFDSPTSYSIVDNCTISGSNHGARDSHKGGAAVSLFMDEDGLVTKNKVLNNTITANVHRGISVLARNNITAIKTAKIADNAVCNNRVENNAAEGIVDGNSEDSIYIANTISGNRDAQNGKVTTGSIRYYDSSTLDFNTTPIGSSLKMQENESPAATSPDCVIPPELATVPPLPPKPGVLGAVTEQSESFADRVRGMFHFFDNLFKQQE